MARRYVKQALLFRTWKTVVLSAPNPVPLLFKTSLKHPIGYRYFTQFEASSVQFRTLLPQHDKFQRTNLLPLVSQRYLKHPSWHRYFLQDPIWYRNFCNTVDTATSDFFNSIQHPMWYRYSCDLSLNHLLPHDCATGAFKLTNTTWKQLTGQWIREGLQQPGGRLEVNGSP